MAQTEPAEPVSDEPEPDERAVDRAAPPVGESSARFWSAALRDDPEPLPERVGSFEILGEIGSGAFGIVLRGRQENPAREVAVKVLRPGATTRETLRRFRQEVEILSRLQHPGIAQVYEAGVADLGRGMQPFYAMEYIRGRPVTQYTAEERPSAREKGRLLLELCRAVHHAHKKGVVHRDLAPSNILVDDEGRPRIVDFGIARPLERDASQTLRTRADQIMGTIPYMSPEQIRAPDGVDTLSDVYALGVVGFEMFTGSLPYDLAGLSAAEAMRVITDVEPRRARELDPDLPRDVECILGRALGKEPERRYASAAEMAEDLQRFLRHEPVLARPTSVLDQIGKLSRRNPGLVGAASLALVFLVLGLAGTTWGLVLARDTERELREQKAQLERAYGHWMGHVLRTIRPSARLTTVEGELLADFEQELTALLAPEPGNAALRALHARVLDAQGAFHAHGGDAETARTRYERARAIWAGLRDEDPGDVDAARGLVLDLVRRGDVARARDDLYGARELYEEGLRLDRELHDLHPEHEGVADDLCWSLERVGHMAFTLGKLDVASELAEERHRLAQRLLEAQPESTKAMYNLCASHGILKTVENASATRDEGLSHAREELRLARELTRRDPSNVLYRSRLAGAHASIAAYLAKDGEVDREGAKEHMRRHLDEVRWFAESPVSEEQGIAPYDPVFAVYGGWLEEWGEPEAARALYAEFLGIGEVLERRGSNLVVALRFQAWAHEALGGLEDHDPASPHRARADALHARLVAFPRAACQDLLRYSRFLRCDLGDAQRALGLADRACSMADPPGARALQERARVLIALGRCQEAALAIGEYARSPTANPSTVEQLTSQNRRD